MNQFRIACLACIVLSAACAPRQPAPDPIVVFVVRHAEKEAGDDPGLNSSGLERSSLLARMLSSAGVQGLYASQYRRTRDTLQPTADLVGLSTQQVDARDVQGLLDRIRRDHPGGVVAVASHSNIVPEILKVAGIEDAPAIPDDQYDDFFILLLQEDGARVIRLKYGRQCPCS